MSETADRISMRPGEQLSTFLIRAADEAREAQDFRITYDACTEALGRAWDLESFRDQSSPLVLQEVFRTALAEIKAAVDHPAQYPGTIRVRELVDWVIEQVGLVSKGQPIVDPMLLPVAPDPEPVRDPIDAFGAHITEGTLGRIGDREIGRSHVVLSEDRYRWLFKRAGLPIDNLPEVAA